MIDPKEAYKKILEEHIKDLETIQLDFVDTYRFGWLASRYHILEILGFKKNEIDTIEKVEKIIEKYNEEIESWRQKKNEDKNKTKFL